MPGRRDRGGGKRIGGVTVLIPPRIFEAARAASTDDRPGLRAILLERSEEGPSVRATNGKLACIATWREDDNDEFPSPSGDLLATTAEGYRQSIPARYAKELVALGGGPCGKAVLSNIALDEKKSTEKGRAHFAGTDLDRVKRLEVPLDEAVFPSLEFIDRSMEKDEVSVHINPFLAIEALQALVKTAGLKKPRSDDEVAEVATTLSFSASYPLRLQHENTEGEGVTKIFVMPLAKGSSAKTRENDVLAILRNTTSEDRKRILQAIKREYPQP
jgi:hypothetical protein